MSISKVIGGGRLGNQITRNIAASIIAKKHDLKIQYQNYDLITKIGIPLFLGSNIYNNYIEVDDNNYFETLETNNFRHNIILKSYCQSKKISEQVHKYLNSDEIVKYFISNNKYKHLYNNNNDCFIHVRLGDTEKWNPGFNYYNHVLSKLNCRHIYIATDSMWHPIIRKILNKYKNVTLMGNDLTDIINFASTCKYVILSYGTFSAIIGYLSFYTTVYCLKFSEKTSWDWNLPDECDMFTNKFTKKGKWIEVDQSSYNVG